MWCLSLCTWNTWHRWTGREITVSIDVNKKNFSLCRSGENNLFSEKCCKCTCSKVKTLKFFTSATELVLHYAADTTPQGIPITHKMLFRAPTTELKYTWKSLLEQKIHNVRGTTTDYYSLSDCSGSAVIIWSHVQRKIANLVLHTSDVQKLFQFICLFWIDLGSVNSLKKTVWCFMSRFLGVNTPWVYQGLGVQNNFVVLYVFDGSI